MADACSNFTEQQWKPNICRECSRPKEQHQQREASNVVSSESNLSDQLERGKQDFIANTVVDTISFSPESKSVKEKVAHFEALIKKQARSKSYYERFPNILDVTNETRLEIKQAKEFTRSILQNLPSGNVQDRNTMCHIISNLLGNKDQQCLFYNSSIGINLHDASANLADLNSEDKPFILKLHSSKGLGKNNVKHEQDDSSLAQQLNDVIEQKQSHPVIEDICERLAKAHNVDKKDIKIISVYEGTFNVVYTIPNLKSVDNQSLLQLEKNLKNEFNEFRSIKIHPLLSCRPSFDISDFDERGNKTFPKYSSTHQIGPPKRTMPYIQPAGWTRYGLRVLGKYKDGDTWLDPFLHSANWYRAFHGTKNARPEDFGRSDGYIDGRNTPIDAMLNIHQNGFKKARFAVYGPGVYCSPDPQWLENSYYVATVEIDTKQGKKKYKCMLQIAANPDGVKFTSESDIWVVSNPEDIRPYGILIKEA
ncbi:unnamed protein product [Adineta steineri]|uniref:Uncharacterized protein n=1 Tax=Adineta steineri TaxID=433720 RepID=A0A813T2J8_9BILA|nr:unnamed protein product [Adineta steineri]CAF1282070.1 unnamed protein product [Adineta steineri]